MSKPSAVCSYCNLQFDDEYDIESICSNAADASVCCNAPSKRAKFKPQVVDENFTRIEDDPMRLDALQSLINSGAAWHPDIDQDGCIGRQAIGLIDRKVLKPPRSKYAKEERDRFNHLSSLGLLHHVKGRM